MQNVENIDLFFLAGVATSANFMDEFKHELIQVYELSGATVQAHTLHPYGDWNRSIVRQISEISFDMLPTIMIKRKNSRGQQVADQIMQVYRGGRIVIIGHSGGGVTAIQAAIRLKQAIYSDDSMLKRAQNLDVRIIQIGSPRYSVPTELRQACLYIRAINSLGKLTDPITRIGNWGGIEKHRFVGRWNSRLKAPATIAIIPIIGGHADYFRNREPFVDDAGKTNLDKTIDLIWNWLSNNKTK